MSINTHAKYTVVLNELLRHPETKAVIDKALSTYPLYKGKKLYDLIPTREELNKRLLNHYKYREIGFETPGRFVDELEIVMCEIMPYYNEMFKSVEIMADLENPFDNVDVVETYSETNSTDTSGTSSGNTKSNSSSTGEDNSSTNTKSSDESTVDSEVNHNSKNVHSETPGNELDITADNIDSVPYADKVTWNKDTNNDTSTTTGTSDTTTKSTSKSSGTSESNSDVKSTSTGKSVSKTEHTYQKKGNQGVNTYAHDMNEFRTSIIDVVNQIITDERISELFMLVY